MVNPGLLLGPIAYDYEVYWDGHRIGVFGRFSPHERWLVPRWEIFHIPPATATIGSHALAIRVGPPEVSFGTREPRLSPADNRVGDIRAIREAEASLHGADFRPRVLNLLIGFAILLAGVYFLLLQPAVSQGTASGGSGCYWSHALSSWDVGLSAMMWHSQSRMNSCSES